MSALIFLLGWGGGLLVVYAYWLSCRRPEFVQDARYFTWNAWGSAGLATNALWHGAIPSTAMNLLWFGIALAALRRLGTRRSTESPPSGNK